MLGANPNGAGSSGEVGFCRPAIRKSTARRGGFIGNTCSYYLRLTGHCMYFNLDLMKLFFKLYTLVSMNRVSNTCFAPCSIDLRSRSNVSIEFGSA